MVPDQASFSLDSVGAAPHGTQLVYGLPGCNPPYPMGCAQFIFPTGMTWLGLYSILSILCDILPDLLMFG